MAERRAPVLIPIVQTRGVAGLLEVARAVVRAQGGSGHVLGVVEIAADREVTKTLTVARRYRSLLQRITEMQGVSEAGLSVQVRVAHNVAQGIRESVYEIGTDTIVLEWPGLASRRRLGLHIQELVADPPADLLLVRPGPEGGDQLSGDVLAPVRGGRSALLALRTAAALAVARGSRLTVMHVYDPRHTAERLAQEREQFRTMLEEARLPADRRLLEVESIQPSAAILAEARSHQATVLGAYADTARSSVLVGSRLEETVRRLPGTVIVAKSARQVQGPQLDPERELYGAPLIGRQREISGLVDKWFAENTFHSREFKDLKRLVTLKQQQGLKISLGLPTLNEAATIHKVLRVMKSELMDRHRLLDEVVVIDSGSTDGTVAIAQDMGVPVVEHSSILPELGTFRGKGEALWKSLHLLTGDIVVWCDTDISNIHPQFVYGVVGPLLTDPRIGYVKGFYRRPLNFGGVLQTAGGGRVTELTARPLVNLFYPELSGMLQPLSGEYAGRRELLERLPFFTGYGVEIGHLIDILESFGLNRLAQVDLDGCRR